MPRPGGRSGQAMVETIVAMLALVVVFLLIFQFADNLRAKLLVQYAAARSARARAVGLDDYMVLKTARVATMPAAGKCLVRSNGGNRLHARQLISRAEDYLECENGGAARNILNFELWENSKTRVDASKTGAARLSVTVRQDRPQYFSPMALLPGWKENSEDGDSSPTAHLEGSFAIEAHYPDWIGL